MKGSILLIACLLAVVMMVAEGKSVAAKKHEKAIANNHDSDDNSDESEEEHETASGSGSGNILQVKLILRY